MLMPRSTLFPLILLATATACADKGPAAEAAQDSVAAIAPEIPRNPRVVAFDVGLAVDSLDRLIGGTFQSIQTADTLYVAVRTQYVAAGTPISIVLRQGTTAVDSVAIVSGTPDADAIGRALATLNGAANVKPGQYHVEAILDGVSQGMRPLAIGLD